MQLAVIGSGYVGLVAGACFADAGNEVICVDNNAKKVEALRRGEIPIYEPGLEDLIKRNASAARLTFTTSLEDAVKSCEVIFIAVGTPQDEDGSADLTHVLDVARGIGKFMNGPKIVVDKSTVPVGTAKLVRDTISAVTKYPVEVVSNPEFLKEGAAIDDFMKPDRVVVGVSSERAAEVMRDLYSPFVRTNNPILVMDVASAEMTKYAANSMLAVRVSFMNEIALLCEKVGADINLVRVGIGTDSRIGMSFLFPGIGYGGSCFPKDVQALIKAGRDNRVDLKLAIAAEEANVRQKQYMVGTIDRHFKTTEGVGTNSLKGKTFAIWGLAFKPRTDDVREAPALTMISELVARGAKIRATDPEAISSFQEKLGVQQHVSYFEDQYAALEDADALIICTEWNNYRRPNFDRIKQLLARPLVFDGRNIFESARMATLGFTYYSVGRSVVNGPSGATQA